MIFESARRPSCFSAGEETQGLLSLIAAPICSTNRVEELAESLGFSLLPDLSRSAVGISIILRPIPGLAVTTALRAVVATNDGSRLRILGSIKYHTFGCGHPTFHRRPYEEYERQFPRRNC